MSRIRTSRLIITITGITLLIAGGVVAMLYFGGIFTPRDAQNTTETTVPSEGTAYQAPLREKQAKVTELIAAGGAASIEEAEKIVEEEVKAAQRSQNSGYIVEAQLTKTSLLVETNRTDQALQTLLDLEKQYANDPEKLYLIYAQLSYAYSLLGEAELSEEYLAKIPGESFDE